MMCAHGRAFKRHVIHCITPDGKQPRRRLLGLCLHIEDVGVYGLIG